MTEYTNQNKDQIRKLSSSTRWNRRIHKFLSIIIAAFLLLSVLTGILLSWKKDVDLIQPPSQAGVSREMIDWMSAGQLASIATDALDSLSIEGGEIDRLDFRPGKGMVKVLFIQGYWEVQLDCTNGKVLSVERRYSDLLEKIHDGSIISDGFKLGVMNIFGFSLIVLLASGLFMWFNPRLIRKIKSAYNPKI